MKMKALGGELFNVPVCTTVLFILFNVVLRAWAQKRCQSFVFLFERSRHARFLLVLPVYAEFRSEGVCVRYSDLIIYTCKTM